MTGKVGITVGRGASAVKVASALRSAEVILRTSTGGGKLSTFVITGVTIPVVVRPKVEERPVLGIKTLLIVLVREDEEVMVMRRVGDITVRARTSAAGGVVTVAACATCVSGAG